MSLPRNGSSFSAYGWTVCAWSLIVAFQVFLAAILIVRRSFVAVWLPHLCPQPNPSCPDLQSITAHPVALYFISPAMYTHVRLHLFSGHLGLHDWRPSW